jgi:hypothetical protein
MPGPDVALGDVDQGPVTEYRYEVSSELASIELDGSRPETGPVLQPLLRVLLERDSSDRWIDPAMT